MKKARYKSFPVFQLIVIFVTTALLMLIYEYSKEAVFSGALTAWDSHIITVIVTAVLAAYSVEREQ